MLSSVRCLTAVVGRANCLHCPQPTHAFACHSSTAPLNTDDTTERLSKSYKILGLSPRCDKQTLKTRYLELAKRYHPDSKMSEASNEKFVELFCAYQFVIDNDFAEGDRSELQSLPKEFDIKHTAPQHRQYLDYDGIGYGTPSQRQRQYQQHLFQKASENVSNYLTEKIVKTSEGAHGELIHSHKEAQYARKWRTQNAIERLVEDLIQESMRRGEFDNLPGCGKPLKSSGHNPYLDVHTQKLNEILVQNGYCPEWVVLEKEIKAEVARLREILTEGRTKLLSPRRSKLSAEFYGNTDDEWDAMVDQLANESRLLNKKIDRFNLVCPCLKKQMVHFNLIKEAKKIVALTTVPVDKETCQDVPGADFGKRSQIESVRTIEGQGIFRSLLNFGVMSKSTN